MNIFIGLLFISGLSVVLGAILWKFGIRDKRAYILFVISLLIHITAVTFIYVADFQPFSGGGGDYGSYHQSAVLIADGIGQGDFFPDIEERGGVTHYFPTIIGYVYFLTTPAMVIGQLFNAWVAAIATVLLYFIVLEVTRSHRWALGIGLLANLYPSFLFYSSLLLKDVFVVLFALASALIMLKILKRFSWRSFGLFYISLIVLTHFRFYAGFVMFVAFIASWLILSQEPIKKRFLYALPMVFFLGFIPQMSGMGYYGLSSLPQYADSGTINYYQDIAYTGLDVAPEEKKPASPTTVPASQEPETPASEEKRPAGFSSTVDIKVSFASPVAFLTSAPEAFAFVALGPFPYQFTEKRHYFALLETIPWAILSVFILLGVIHAFRTRHRALSLVFFSLGLFLILMIYMSNFGITTRIRMPAFLLLTAFIPFGVIEYQRWKPRIYKFFHANKK